MTLDQPERWFTDGRERRRQFVYELNFVEAWTVNPGSSWGQRCAVGSRDPLNLNISICIYIYIRNRPQMKRWQNCSLHLYFGRTKRPSSGWLETVTQEHCVKDSLSTEMHRAQTRRFRMIWNLHFSVGAFSFIKSFVIVDIHRDLFLLSASYYS